MPTVEIIAYGAKSLDIKQEDFEIAIIEENTLRTHRWLFYEFLLGKKGIILHLGNPDFVDDKEGEFFGGQLFDWNFISPAEPTDSNQQRGIMEIGNLGEEPVDTDQSFYTQFKEQYRQQMRKLFEIAQRGAVKGKMYFLTDYQFGPKYPTIVHLTSAEFWIRHDQTGIRLNTIYVITE